jgi:hypothetical protein
MYKDDHETCYETRAVSNAFEAGEAECMWETTACGILVEKPLGK